MQYVRVSPTGGLVFPPNIPGKRVNCLCGNGPLYLSLIISISTILICLSCAEIIIRLCALLEETRHLHSRYNGDMVNLLKHVFTFSTSFIVSTIISFFSLLLIYFITTKNPFYLIIGSNWLFVTVLFISMRLFEWFLKFEQSPLHTALQFSHFDGLDYGSGMAHSFFHGYLRLILPDTGLENDKNIREFLKEYEAQNTINFEVYKLFILIPLSQYCPARLDSNFSSSVEACNELNSKHIDRAGVQKRNYKNSVYKIKTLNGRIKYVCAEYATPVKTLHEVMEQNTIKGRLYRKHRTEILLNFYLTLRELLRNDPNCHDFCELIYYDDKNENGDFLDVGGIILHRLERIKKNI